MIVTVTVTVTVIVHVHLNVPVTVTVTVIVAVTVPPPLFHAPGHPESKETLGQISRSLPSGGSSQASCRDCI